MGDVKCLNPWDVQSKHVMSIDGKCESICAGEKRWAGLAPNVCYAIEGNVVDRVSAKNGKGWCEGVSPTLNTQDRHAVVYALEGNGARPSHLGCGYSDDGKMYTLNTIEQHAVCYDARGNGTGDIVSTLTGDHQNRITDYTAIVCVLASTCKNAEITDGTISPTLMARAGTGGNQLPIALIRKTENRKTAGEHSK